MATSEAVIAAIRTEVGGDATAMDDNYRNDTSKLTPGTLYYQLRAAIQMLSVLDGNNTHEILGVELEFFHVRPTAEAETVFTESAVATNMQPTLRKYLNSATWKGITGIRNVAGAGDEGNVDGSPELGDIERVGDLIRFTLTTQVVVSN